jgi:hypothetical protein
MSKKEEKGPEISEFGLWLVAQARSALAATPTFRTSFSRLTAHELLILNGVKRCATCLASKL